MRVNFWLGIFTGGVAVKSAGEGIFAPIRSRRSLKSNLDFSQIFEFVGSPPVAGRLGSGLPGAKAFAVSPDGCRNFVRISHGDVRHAG